MAKKSKKQRTPNAANVLSAVAMIVPAVLAAATAFMNTLAARDNGTIETLIGDGKKRRKK